MKGADRIFIHGEEIARKKDLNQFMDMAVNIVYNETESIRNELNQAISTVYKYKGSVANEASLPTENNAVGDVYNCEDTGNNFAWTGTAWDKLAGTVSSPNDLLHYKGHVDSVTALPSLGQTSAAINTTAPNYNDVNVGRKDANLSAYDVTAGPSTLYYVASRYKETSDAVPDGCLCLKTDYPGVISVIRYDMNGHSIGILVHYYEDKPVYWDRNKDGAWGTITENKMFMVYDGAIRTNFPLKAPTWIPGSISTAVGGVSYSGYVTQAYRYAQATNPATNLTYYYDPGYVVMVPESDSSDYVRLYFGDSLAKHGDVYTVGENNDVYYCNTSQEWEQWAKAPVTKEYVDKAIADALAALTGE